MTRVDLHLHTTASDGRCSPHELVERAAQAALTVIAVTDHDTTAAVSDVHRLAAERGMEAVTGIEITAIEDGRDVHILGYFFDPLNEALGTWLAAQRAARIARVEAIGARLEALGMPVDVRPLVSQAAREPRRSLGRPQVARLMIEAGYVADSREAFDRWLSLGCPAFVPRAGPAPETVIDAIHDAGGIASLAHPGKRGLEARVAPLAAHGLDAVEAFHPDHDGLLVDRYVGLARELKLLITGGSDFHGDPAHGLEPGSVTLPPGEWARLQKVRHARR